MLGNQNWGFGVEMCGFPEEKPRTRLFCLKQLARASWSLPGKMHKTDTLFCVVPGSRGLIRDFLNASFNVFSSCFYSFFYWNIL